MMKNIILIMALMVFFSGVSLTSLAKTINLPKVEAREAIMLAEDHLKDSGISVENHVLLRMEYLNLYNEHEKPGWFLQWHPLGRGSIRMLGGQIFVSVYNDRTVEVTYGE